MRIIYLSDEYPPHAIGGAGVIVERLARQFAADGHQVGVIVPSPEISAVLKEQRDGVTVWRLPRNPAMHPFRTGLNNPELLKRLESLLEEIKPDIIHAHNIQWHLSFGSLPLARRFTRRVFFTAHDTLAVSYTKTFPPAKARKSGVWEGRDLRLGFFSLLRQAKWEWVPGRSAAIRAYLGSASKIFSVSAALKDFLQANAISPVEVMHNGIDAFSADVASESAKAFAVRHNLDGAKVLFLAGRVGSAKGLHVALHALAVAQKAHPDAVLALAASDADRMEIERAAQHYGVSTRLRFLGWLGSDGMRLAYAAAHVVLVPSLYLDPFPTINLEAMASARPLVGTCFGGTPEAIEDGVTGFIVNPYEISRFAEKISLLLDNPELCMKFGEAGRRRVQERFSLKKQTQKLLHAYQEA